MEKKKILIVDDQYGVRKLLVLALGDYQVQEASSGKQAIEKAESWSPDLMIIDMKMPESNGLETIEHLKNTNNTSKYILMTAYSETEVQIGNNKGISGFINKPFDLDQLAELVKKVLNEKPGY